MNFASGLIHKAELWLDCKETSENRSVCVDKIHEYYNGKVVAEAWCAKFVFMITDLVCKDFGFKNFLPRTASTITMVNNAPKKGLRVDKIPAPGSVFFKTREGGGHVGFVIEVDGTIIKTIEGNHNDKVAYVKRTDYSTYKFIHTEEMPQLNGKRDEGMITYEKQNIFYDMTYFALTDNNMYYLAGGLALLGASSYYFMKKK